MVIGSDEPPTVIVALIASESSKSKDSVFAYSGSSTIVYVPVTGKGSQEMRRLDGELSRLTAAVASGGDLPALLAAVKERQAQRERSERALIELDATARIGRHEIPRLEREIRHRLADWRAMLRREVPEAREILRNLVVGRIALKPRPEARVYEFSGRGSFGRLLAGTTCSVSVVTPAGFATVGAYRNVLGNFRVA